MAAPPVPRRSLPLCTQRTVGVTDTTHLGWYGRYAPSVNSRRLLHEAGFRYDSDSYCDDMPYWETVGGEPHLVIPYSIQNNDAHLAYGSMPGMADAFFESIKVRVRCTGRGPAPWTSTRA